ncbi:O(6)-methylguanine-induced apoptosis 2-like [Tubulanus polymorphus]|uniref:O(6)-methylguanine-induced apoptosis 2-like n=1 Tax=Tubulanus polymorphus TaxID=672921 RepID=UPI003DA37709
MVDSIKSLDSDFVKRIHSRTVSGRLHKGHSVVAPTSSIPSKYQTIVIDNSENKGFQSKAKRFQHDLNQNDNPGPGSYLSHKVDVENKSASYSKKGTGGFASKDKRITKHDPGCSPGAGSYNVALTLLSRKDFNKAPATRSFHMPIANPTEKLNGVPAPNQYSVLDQLQRVCKSNNVSANAAFKSQSKRELIDTKYSSVMPAPWQYEINDRLLHDSVKIPTSSFKSKSMRKMAETPPPNPGPGTYNPNEPIDAVGRLQFPRKHYLCISAPAMPLPNPLPGPGPGSYELVNYEGIPKHYMSSSVFVSNTSRWTGDGRKKSGLPGPAHYRPSSFGKQSFIYNAAGRWI